jgi:hypothetical protein
MGGGLELGESFVRRGRRVGTRVEAVLSTAPQRLSKGK